MEDKKKPGGLAKLPGFFLLGLGQARQVYKTYFLRCTLNPTERNREALLSLPVSFYLPSRNLPMRIFRTSVVAGIAGVMLVAICGCAVRGSQETANQNGDEPVATVKIGRAHV